MPVLHSTKNLEIIERPTPTRAGVGVFEYTDHYTVFHYGRMPDPVPGKGEAIAHMAAFNFAMLEAAGVRTHFRRFIAPNRIEFDLARVAGPDTGPLSPNAGPYLVPVQVLIRTELPRGSSVHRRLAAGTLTLADLGLTSLPAHDQRLERPLVEYATMLEDVNRYVSASEAQCLAELSDVQFQTMRDTALAVDELLTGHSDQVGLRHCDGKVEFLVSSDGHLVVADSPGTPDECRLMFGTVHCGKQILRDWYVAHRLEIPVDALINDGVPRSHWPAPAPLPPGFVPVMSDLYRALSETWTGQRRWNAPSLKTATQAVTSLIQ